jgi:hypothetical protein
MPRFAGQSAVIGEEGHIHMFLLEATFDDPSLASGIETAIAGAHGALIPAAVLAASRSS